MKDIRSLFGRGEALCCREREECNGIFANGKGNICF